MSISELIFREKLWNSVKVTRREQVKCYVLKQQMFTFDSKKCFRKSVGAIGRRSSFSTKISNFSLLFLQTNKIMFREKEKSVITSRCVFFCHRKKCKIFRFLIFYALCLPAALLKNYSELLILQENLNTQRSWIKKIWIHHDYKWWCVINSLRSRMSESNCV